MQTLQTLVEHFKLLSDNSSNNTKHKNKYRYTHTLKLSAFALGLDNRNKIRLFFPLIPSVPTLS